MEQEFSYGHTKTINSIKYSNDYRLFASASDDQKVIIWKKKNRNFFGSSESKFCWSEEFILIGHSKEVFDISFCKSDKTLVSGSLDNSIIGWDVGKGRMLFKLYNHKYFVKSLAFNYDSFISFSCDRSAIIWKQNKKKNDYYLKNYISRVKDTNGNFYKLFIDNIEANIYSRIDYSPDGNLLILGCGRLLANNNKFINCALIYATNNYDFPSLSIQLNNETPIIVKFSKYLYKKKFNNSELFCLGYAMFYVIATKTTVYLCSTEYNHPLYAIGGLHYASISDITFVNHSIFCVTSLDGYISFYEISEDDYVGILDYDGIPDSIKENFKLLYDIHNNKITKEAAPLPSYTVISDQKIFKRADGKKVIIPKKIQNN